MVSNSCLFDPWPMALLAMHLRSLSSNILQQVLVVLDRASHDVCTTVFCKVSFGGIDSLSRDEGNPIYMDL